MASDLQAAHQHRLPRAGARRARDRRAARRAAQGARARRGGWHELEAEDGTIALDLAKVVFVRVETPATSASASASDRHARASSPGRGRRRSRRCDRRRPAPCAHRRRTRPPPSGSCAAYSRLGQHGACWLALGAAGRGARPGAPRALAPRDASRSRRVRRQPGGQARRAAPAPAARRAAAADRDADAAELPERARRDLVRGRARLRRPAAAPRRCGSPRSRWPRRASTSASTTRRISSPAWCSGRRSADGRRDEGRHRRHAERRQVLALQRADARRRGGGQLPVHDDRAERRDRAGRRRAPGARRGDAEGVARSSTTRSPSTTSPGS